MNLLTEIKLGNEDAFEEAYLLWRKKGFYYFRRRTSEEEARDLLQITFLRLWQYRQSLNDEYSLDQQMFHISRTVLIDHIRRARKQPQSAQECSGVIEHKLTPAFQSIPRAMQVREGQCGCFWMNLL